MCLSIESVFESDLKDCFCLLEIAARTKFESLNFYSNERGNRPYLFYYVIRYLSIEEDFPTIVMIAILELSFLSITPIPKSSLRNFPPCRLLLQRSQSFRSGRLTCRLFPPSRIPLHAILRHKE